MLPRTTKRQKLDHDRKEVKVEVEPSEPSEPFALLKTRFPFGKYSRKSFTVAHFLLDTNYLQWCEKTIDWWPSHPLRQLLVKEGMLLEKEKTINPKFYLDCLEVTQQQQGRLQRRKTEEKEKQSKNTESCCSICLESCTTAANENIRYIWMPCGHATLCQSCYFSRGQEVSLVKNCPVCKRELNPFQPVKKIFL